MPGECCTSVAHAPQAGQTVGATGVIVEKGHVAAHFFTTIDRHVASHTPRVYSTCNFFLVRAHLLSDLFCLTINKFLLLATLFVSFFFFFFLFQRTDLLL
jgi:hypothetical protein